MSRLSRLLHTAVALALVAGFYVLAVALVGGYGFFGVVMARIVFAPEDDGSLPVALLQIGFAAAAVAVIPQIFARAGSTGPRPRTVAVDEDAAPGLWDEVVELAERTGVAVPTEIRLTAEANAAVVEDVRTGARGIRERRLYLGLPLLAGLRADELRAVLCHELGHYAQGHTRFAARVYQGAEGLDAACRTFAKPEVGNPITTAYTGFQHLTLRVYAWLYNVLSFAVRRRQELDADAAAAYVAGPEAAAAALTSAAALGRAWEDFRTGLLDPMAAAGRMPDDPLRAFAAMLDDPGYRNRVAARPGTAPTPARHPFDSHPPLERRLEALRSLPCAVEAERDLRPAYRLVNPDGTLPEPVLAVLLPTRPPGRRRRTRPWADWLAEAAEVRAVRAVEELHRAVGLIAMARPTTGGVLELLTGGRGPELVDALRDAGWGEGWRELWGGQEVDGVIRRAHGGSGGDGGESSEADGDIEDCYDGGRWVGEPWWRTAPEHRAAAGPRAREARRAAQREADARRAALAVEVLVAQALVAAGRARWTFRWDGPGRAVAEDEQAAEALELAPGAPADPQRAARLRSCLLLCRVGMDDELSSAGRGSALRVPPEPPPAEPATEPPRKLFPAAAFLMALLTLLLFGLRWQTVNREPPSPPPLPRDARTEAPLYRPVCPPGYRQQGLWCLPVDEAPSGGPPTQGTAPQLGS
ncbi:M48 family metalloprotease [Streptomyces sp. HNM0663]|uniref:M48 family metalloprotease n=1 Tax=Streptomyces chengmaiensis TaxID=3040919 RepID=A0ABT6HFC1_9ACTN|nr:M48 family metallopeptidase [Streptomyces chengmaiensis]MDH2387260.1 M48 family metalloprotease [Streptomyces chengmaiensis]